MSKRKRTQAQFQMMLKLSQTATVWNKGKDLIFFSVTDIPEELTKKYRDMRGKKIWCCVEAKLPELDKDGQDIIDKICTNSAYLQDYVFTALTQNPRQLLQGPSTPNEAAEVERKLREHFAKERWQTLKDKDQQHKPPGQRDYALGE